MSNKRKVFEFVLSMKTKGASTWGTSRKGMAAFNKEVKSGNKLLNTMQGRVLGLVGAYAGLSGVSQMITSVLSGQKEMEIMARTAGLGVGDFQAYAYAVRSVGIESDKLADISKDVKDKIGDFIETGGGEFADFFENIAPKVGITAEELQKLSGPDALIAVKKALDDAGISAENQIFYLEALANDTSLLIPLLKDGGKALKEQAAAGRELGVAISEMDREKLKEVNAAIREMQGSLEVLRRDIVVALAPAIKELTENITENKEELTQFAVGTANAAAAVAEFALEHQDLIVFLAKTAVGLLAVSKVITVTTTIWGGLNAASLAMTGSRLIPYLATLRTALLASASAGQLLGAALLIGWSGQQVMTAVGEYNAMRDAQKDLKVHTDALAASEAKMAEKLKKVTAETGVTVNNVMELAYAVRDGKIHFDKASDTWKTGAKKISDSMAGVATATNESFTAQERISSEKLSKMAAAYKKYTDLVKKYNDEILGRERSLAEDLRNMGRSGMSDLGAWKDRKKEAQEYEQAARVAAVAGNFDEAVRLADKAKAAYTDLNKEVKSGEKIAISQQKGLKTAMEGVSRAGEIAIEAIEEQQKAAKEVAENIDNETGGRLSQLADLADDFDMSWDKAWGSMEKGGEDAIKNLDKRLDNLTKDRHVNVYVNEIEQHASGGLAGVMGFASGGSPMQFPRLTSPYIMKGSGLRDDVPAMLTRKEFVQPAQSVDHYGVDAMEALRLRKIPRALLRGYQEFSEGGLAVPLGMRSAPISLPSSTSGASSAQANHFEVNVQYTSSGSSSAQQDVRELARMLMPELKRQWARSSH